MGQEQGPLALPRECTGCNCLFSALPLHVGVAETVDLGSLLPGGQASSTRLLQLLLAGGLSPWMGGKLLCNRTTGSEPAFLGYHRQTRDEGAGRGGRGRRGRARSQHQVSPKSCLRNPRPRLALGATCSGESPGKCSSHSLLLQAVRGSHQVPTAQAARAPLKEPSCLLRPESDLGAPGSPQATFLRPLPHPAVLATDVSHHQVAWMSPLGFIPRTPSPLPNSGA